MSRVVRVSDGYARYSTNGHANTCGDCPVRDRHGLCRIRAEHVAAARPCCRYGHQKMVSARELARLARKSAQDAEDSHMKDISTQTQKKGVKQDEMAD